MSSRFLPVVIENALFALPPLVSQVQSGRATLGRALDFCTGYRRCGIAELLLRGHVGTFHQNLQCSGSAFAAFLERARVEDRTASKCAPFFDAVASGDFDCAGRIAKLAANTVHNDFEYEDDFLYMRILFGVFFLPTASSDLAAMLKRYETLLDGAEDSRFTICKSLIAGDAMLFEAALDDLIATREDDYTAGIDADNILEEEWSTEGKVFVEGLALVRLASLRHFETQNNFLFIPSIAVAQQAPSFDANLWMNPIAMIRPLQ